MPKKLFKNLSDQTALIDGIYELLSEHANVGYGKINCIVALQCEEEVFAQSNVKRKEAITMLNELINNYTPSTTDATYVRVDY